MDLIFKLIQLSYELSILWERQWRPRIVNICISYEWYKGKIGVACIRWPFYNERTIAIFTIRRINKTSIFSTWILAIVSELCKNVFLRKLLLQWINKKTKKSYLQFNVANQCQNAKNKYFNNICSEFHSKSNQINYNQLTNKNKICLMTMSRSLSNDNILARN